MDKSWDCKSKERAGRKVDSDAGREVQKGGGGPEKGGIGKKARRQSKPYQRSPFVQSYCEPRRGVSTISSFDVPRTLDPFTVMFVFSPGYKHPRPFTASRAAAGPRLYLRDYNPSGI